MEMSKEEVRKNLGEFELFLTEKIGTQKRRIIDELGEASVREPEGVFTKTILSPVLNEFFANNVVIEGPTSKLQFKKNFFGSKPAPDFVIEKPTVIMGEVKYADFAIQNIGQAIGQVLLYKTASKCGESRVADYGCIVFFDKSMKFTHLQLAELNLKNELWAKFGIFVIIL